MPKTADRLQNIRVTRLGRDALSGPNDDPLSRARAHLAGAKADAVTAAVEEALKGRLHELASAHAIKTTKASGAPISLAALADALASAGAYREPPTCRGAVVGRRPERGRPWTRP